MYSSSYEYYYLLLIVCSPTHAEVMCANSQYSI